MRARSTSRQCPPSLHQPNTLPFHNLEGLRRLCKSLSRRDLRVPQLFLLRPLQRLPWLLLRFLVLQCFSLHYRDSRRRRVSRIHQTFSRLPFQPLHLPSHIRDRHNTRHRLCMPPRLRYRRRLPPRLRDLPFERRRRALPLRPLQS